MRQEKFFKRLLSLKHIATGSNNTSLSEMDKIMKAIFIEEYDLSMIDKMKEHRRFEVYYYKGTVCVSCGVVGTRVIKSMRFPSSIHIDLFTDDLVLMTVDHIIPKSKGGSNQLHNKQPMCYKCNFKKGDKIDNSQQSTPIRNCVSINS